MFTIKRFAFKEAALADQALAIRRAVFVEEQGVDPALEYDHEEESHHYLLLLEGRPLATARWRETEKGIKLERFAVLPAFRNRGIGQIILKEVLKDLTDPGSQGEKKLIYLHSQVRAVPFYERNGFKKEGPLFTEAGIDHYLMTYSLPAF